MIHILNDSIHEQKFALGPVLRVVNAVLAVGTVAFAVAALADPALLVGGEIGNAATFYAQLYAARAIPLGIAVSVLVLRPWGRGLLAMLVVAGAAQAGDLAVGVSQANPGMTIGAAVATVVPLWSAWRLWSAR